MVFERKMDEQEYIAKLKDKLIAKIDAVVQENKNTDFLKELADILEIIYALGTSKNFSPKDLENQRHTTKLEKGGFNNRIYNRYIVMKEDNPAVEYYRSNRAKYPEFDKKFNAVLVNKRLRKLIKSKPSKAEEKYDRSRFELYKKFEEILYKSNDKEIAKALDLFVYDDFLERPIIIDLVAKKKIKFLKALYKKNMPFTYVDFGGGNALHVACAVSGDLECVKFLIENNLLTDIHAESLRGETPYTLAVSYNHANITDYLEEKFHINYIKLNHVKTILETNRHISGK